MDDRTKEEIGLNKREEELQPERETLISRASMSFKQENDFGK